MYLWVKEDPFPLYRKVRKSTKSCRRECKTWSMWTKICPAGSCPRKCLKSEPHLMPLLLRLRMTVCSAWLKMTFKKLKVLWGLGTENERHILREKGKRNKTAPTPSSPCSQIFKPENKNLTGLQQRPRKLMHMEMCLNLKAADMFVQVLLEVSSIFNFYIVEYTTLQSVKNTLLTT